MGVLLILGMEALGPLKRDEQVIIQESRNPS